MSTFLFPASTDHVIAHLQEAAGTDPVVGSSPETNTARYVRCRRTGGAQVSPVTETAQFTLDIYDTYDDDAEKFTATIRAAARDLAGTHGPDFDCKRYTEYGGPASMPDPEAPTLSRYRLTFALLLKGRTA